MVPGNMWTNRSKSPRRPSVLVFAGPNGSGKSTITKKLPVCGTYVNADDLKEKYHLSDLEAAQQADDLRKVLLSRRADFSFETVLSTDRNLLLLKKARESGYIVHCVYVLTCDPDINVSRVRDRVAAGGHDVPEEKIRSRYYRALALLPGLIEVCDEIAIYDNSTAPTLIFKKENGITEFYENPYWTPERLRSLVKGS